MAVHFLCQPEPFKDKHCLVLPDIPCVLVFPELPSQYCTISKMPTFLLAVETQGSPAKFCKDFLVFHSLKPEAFSRGGHGTKPSLGGMYPSHLWKAVTAAKFWSEPILHTLHKVRCALFSLDLHFGLQFCNVAMPFSAPWLRVTLLHISAGYLLHYLGAIETFNVSYFCT